MSKKRMYPNSTKQRIYAELAGVPGVWMTSDQLHQLFNAIYGVGIRRVTIDRALRKLRQTGEIFSRPLPGKHRNKQQWRYSQTGQSTTAPTTVAIQPVNGKTIMVTANPNAINLTDAIDIVLDAFTKAQKTFSTHDVTMELRNRVNTAALSVTALDGTCTVNGVDVSRIKHAKVRDYVHAKYDNGDISGYSRKDNGAYFLYVPSAPSSIDDDDDDDSSISGATYDGSAAL